MFIKDYNKTALINGDDRISYTQLIDHIKDYASLMNVKKSDRIAIFFENRPEWVYSFYAGWHVGAINVLIDTMSVQNEVEYILNDCEPAVIITSEKNLPLVQECVKSLKYSPRIINVDKIGSIVRGFDIDANNPNDEDIALLLYTSGTTGSSKGVMLTYKNVMINVEWNNKPGRINIKDTMIAVLPNHHSWPLMATILCPLDCGATVAFIKKLTGDEIMSIIKNQHVTMVTAVPRLFEMFHKGIISKINANPVAKILLKITRNSKLYGLNKKIFKKVHEEFGGNIKVFISGGAPLDKEIIKDYRGMGILMVEGYGLTETAPMVTFHPFDAQRIGSVGIVFSDIDIKILDDGEIILKGPNVMKGYWNKPEETAAVLKNGWFYTGDLGVLDKDRYLYITGRKKDLIILPNGKNIRPDLIEFKLKEQFSVIEDVAVTEKNSLLFAVIKPNMLEVKKSGITNLYETIKWKVIDQYNQQVENYKKIHDFIIINEDIPKTRMGKIKRYMLKQFVDNREKTIKKESIPEFEEFAVLAGIIEDVCGTSPFPSNHLEIDLGLDSLSLIELQLRVEKTFGITFQEGELAAYPTVLDLAEKIRTSRTKMQEDSIDWKEIFSKNISIKLSDKIWMMKLLLFLFRLFFKRKLNLKISGADNIPAGACIIAPNHESFLDSLVLSCGLPGKTLENIYFFAKEKNFDFWLAKIFADRGHVVVMDINKNLIQSLQTIAAVLKSGKQIVIFPEGARSRDGKLQPFKKSFAIISKELNVPIIPVVINGTYESLPIGGKIPMKGSVSVRYMPPVLPAGRNEADISNEVYGKIAENIL